MLAKAVRRGLSTPFLVGDLPFGSYEVSDEQAVATAFRFVKEAGCDAVKLEGGGETSVARARAIVNAGIPVMGHVGLTPQTSTALGGYRAQGRTAEAATAVAREALALQEAGCFCDRLRGDPERGRRRRSCRRWTIPVIGIGAGPATDGQVLVFHDLLGIREGRGARFVKRYADMLDEMVAGVAAYADDVRARRYPGPEHGYSIDGRGARRPSAPRSPSDDRADARSHRFHTLHSAARWPVCLRSSRPADREFFDLFEEAGGEHRPRGADLLDQMLAALPRRKPSSRATS